MFCIEYFIVIISSIGKEFLFSYDKTCKIVSSITHVHSYFVGAYNVSEAHLYHLECSLIREISLSTLLEDAKYMQAYTNLILHGNNHKFQEIMFRL